MEHKGDVDSLRKKPVGNLAEEAGYRSARAGVPVSKVMQEQLKRNPRLMERFMKGATGGQRERQENDRKQQGSR